MNIENITNATKEINRLKLLLDGEQKPSQQQQTLEMLKSTALELIEPVEEEQAG